jgi:hypothetical protein
MKPALKRMVKTVASTKLLFAGVAVGEQKPAPLASPLMPQNGAAPRARAGNAFAKNAAE